MDDQRKRTKTEVIILGGGVAGLAAAAVLLEFKIPFVLIEGRLVMLINSSVFFFSNQ